MEVEITVTKEELAELGQLASERIKSFVWAQISRSPAETGDNIDLGKIDITVAINVV